MGEYFDGFWSGFVVACCLFNLAMCRVYFRELPSPFGKKQRPPP